MVADWMEVDWFDPSVLLILLIGWYFLLRHWESNGTLDRWDSTRIFGIALMIRTSKGQDTLEVISKPRRFWRAYGEVSLRLCQLVMIMVFLLFLLSFIAAIFYPPDVEPLSLGEMVAIPGVNPVIPLGWGLLAFVVALVIHEYGHGIQARAHGMRVRSFGLLMLGPIPLGAFAEPAGEELMRAPSNERQRMFAAGPSTNLFACVFCILVLGGLAGQFVAAAPGLHAYGIVAESGADEAGLMPFDVITHIEGKSMADIEDFQSVMDEHRAGQVVNLTVISQQTGQTSTLSLNLSDKHQHYIEAGYDAEYLSEVGIEPGDAFVGVIGLAGGTAGVDRLAGPLSPNIEAPIIDRAISTIPHTLNLLITPFENKGSAVHPIEEEMLAEGDGWFAQMVGVDGLLFLVYLAFWLFWVNLLLGFTNLLPMVPFDGGHMLRDGFADFISLIDRFGRRFKLWAIHPLKMEHIVYRTSSRSSLVMLVMLLAILFLPYL